MSTSTKHTQLANKMDRQRTVETHDDNNEPYLNMSTANIIVVDNLPRAEMNLYKKLYALIKKRFSVYGEIIDDGFYIPVEGPQSAQMTCGYAFIEYQTAEMATRAVGEGNMKRLDPNHTLLVNHYDDFDKYSKVTPEYAALSQGDYESKVNLNLWLLDQDVRDMFVVRAGSETQVYFNDPLKRPQEFGRELKYAGEREKAQGKNWTDLYVAWSPKGSYLLTFHEPGVVVWGGENFEKLGRFPHLGVSQIEFSPCEKYLLTCNGSDKSTKVGIADPECYIVWDVRSGKKLRGFDMEQGDQWPVFKWSQDDKFIARRNEKESSISVYETPTMNMLDKKSIKVSNVKDFAWSPSANLMSYCIAEESGKPASVAVIELPSREVKREKHLFNVVDIRLHWHDQGDYLCVKVARRKTKKSIVTNFEIFRIHQKEMPIETVELEANIVAFAWEPHGHRFAIIHSGSEGTKNHVAVYNCKGKEVKKLKVFENRQANALFWSPLGGQLVLAGLGPFNGQFEWLDIDAMESLTPGGFEHFQAGECEWDPSGRYVITSSTQPISAGGRWKYGMDNGYKLWNLQGQLLADSKMEHCYQVAWRPRPQNLLTKEHIVAVKANLREQYWNKFEHEDDVIRKGHESEEKKEREKLKQEWKAYRQAKEKEYQEEKKMRRELRNGQALDAEDDYVTVETQVEEEVSRAEEAWKQ